MFQVLASKIEFSLSRTAFAGGSCILLRDTGERHYVDRRQNFHACADDCVGRGGVCGLFIVYAALCFFTTEGLEVMNIFTDGGREIRTVSVLRLRRGGAEVFYLRCAARAVSVLSVFIFDWTKRQCALYVSAACGVAVSDSVLYPVAGRRAAL